MGNAKKRASKVRGTKPDAVIHDEVTPEAKLEEISKDIAVIEKDAKKIVVKDEQSLASASEFLVQLKGRINRIKTLMDSFTKPWRDQRKTALAEINRIESLFGDKLHPYEDIERQIKGAIGDFHRAQDEAAKKEEERLAKLRDKQNERREEKGQAPIVAPLPVVPRTEATQKTDAGSATAKKVWKFEIEAYSQLPQNVIEEVLYQAKEAGIHDKVIRKMVNAGVREIAGVRIYEDFDVSVRAR